MPNKVLITGCTHHHLPIQQYDHSESDPPAARSYWLAFNVVVLTNLVPPQNSTARLGLGLCLHCFRFSAGARIPKPGTRNPCSQDFVFYAVIVAMVLPSASGHACTSSFQGSWPDSGNFGCVVGFRVFEWLGSSACSPCQPIHVSSLLEFKNMPAPKNPQGTHGKLQNFETLKLNFLKYPETGKPLKPQRPEEPTYQPNHHSRCPWIGQPCEISW